MEPYRAAASTPSVYLERIFRELEGEALQWLKNTENMMVPIAKGFLGIATESDIDTFHTALRQRFKLGFPELTNWERSPYWEVRRLEQHPSEQLEHYYERARDLLLVMHGHLRFNDAGGTLTPAEVALHAMVIDNFVQGLDRWISPTQLLEQQINHPKYTLHQVYKIIEGEIQIMDFEKGKEVHEGDEQKRRNEEELGSEPEKEAENEPEKETRIETGQESNKDKVQDEKEGEKKRKLNTDKMEPINAKKQKQMTVGRAGNG